MESITNPLEFVKQKTKEKGKNFSQFCEEIQKSSTLIRSMLKDPAGIIVKSKPTARKIEAYFGLKFGTLFPYAAKHFLFLKDSGFKTNEYDGKLMA